MSKSRKKSKLKEGDIVRVKANTKKGGPYYKAGDLGRVVETYSFDAWVEFVFQDGRKEGDGIWYVDLCDLRAVR